MRRNVRQVGFWSAANLAVFAFALIPVLWIISLSLKGPKDFSDRKFLPANPSLDNYDGIFKDSQFTHALLNSIGISLIATLIAVVLGSMAAYALARLQFGGKTLILSSALAIAMFPPIAIIGPIFNIWRNVGLYDTWPGLIIPYMTFTLPLAIYTLSAFFREIPWELEQAAQVDGATPFRACSPRRSSSSSSRGTTSCSRSRSPRPTSRGRSLRRSPSSPATPSSPSRWARSPRPRWS